MNKQCQQKTLVLVIYSLTSGGAERVMSVLANHWAEKGWNIVLLTIEDKGGDFYPLNHHVKRINLKMGDDAHSFLMGLKNNYHHLRAMRKVFKQYKPSCIISFMDTTNVLSILAAFGTKIPVIVSERIHPAFHAIGTVWDRLRAWTYPYAKSLVVQTEDIAHWSRRLVSSEKIEVIPNPVWLKDQPFSTVINLPTLPKGFLILAMGRLTHQKGFDILIKAFKQSNLASYDGHLIILGDGILQRELEALIVSEELTDSVRLLGEIPNPQDVIHQADLFVLSSRYEGFPNALLEAMAVGCAVISSDCHSGPRDIIEEGVNGLLTSVDDVDQLAGKMKSLFENDAQRAVLKKNAINVRETYSIEKITEQWESVIEKVCRH